jgi:hypothetical protein
MDKPKLPEAAVEALTAMSVDQLNELIGGIREGLTVVDSQPVAEAIAAGVESIGALELGEDKAKAESVVREAFADEIGRAYVAAAFQVHASDLPDAAKEAVLGALSAQAGKYSVTIPALKAEESEPVTETDTEPDKVAELTEKVTRMEAEKAAGEAIDALTSPKAVKSLIREDVVGSKDKPGRIVAEKLDSDGAREAVTRLATSYQRASEAYGKTDPEFDGIGEPERATEDTNPNSLLVSALIKAEA